MSFRVIHFLPYYPPHIGGVEMYAKEWAENYIKEDWKVCIVTFSGWQEAWSRIEEDVEVIVLPAFDVVHSFPFPMFWYPSFWRWLRLARNWNADIVHTHTRFFLSSLLWGVFAKCIHKPWIHIEHGSWLVVSSRKLISTLSRWYDYTFGRLVLYSCDSVVAISKACKEFTLELAHVKKISVIYRGITPVVSHVERNKQSILIGFVGRLVDLKWVDILIQAFASIQNNPLFSPLSLKLQIIGDGPERKKLEKLTQTLKIQEHVEFLGLQSSEKIREYFLPSFHIFVNPSFQEWLPTTVMEALCAWCNVIATDVWGTRELLDFSYFSLIPSWDISALQNAMIEILRLDQGEMKSWATYELFSWKHSFQQFITLYNSII